MMKSKKLRTFTAIGLCTLVMGMVYSFCTVSHRTPPTNYLETVLQQIPSDGKYIILVDFSKASAQERLFVYDIPNQKYVYSGVVQHGLGRGSTAFTPEFSNEIGSNCSSLGLYRLTSYSKIYRIPYVDIPCFRMDGLSSTNSNARARGILIHPSISATLLPFELWGVPLPLTPESMGCFAVSIHTMWKIKQLYDEGDMYLYAFVGDMV